LTDDRELHKQIAEEAQLGGADTSAGVRAFQFFLVPLAIVAVCIMIYWGLSHVVANPRKPDEWLKDVKEGGLNTRPHAALKLVEALRRAETPDRSLTPGILDLFRSTKADEEVLRKTLLNCLGVLGDPRASEFLADIAVKEGNLEERAAALDALGAIKDPGTLPMLVKLLDDPNAVVRKYAAFNAGAVAGRTGDAGVLEPLRARLKDASPDVGWNAAFALAYFLRDASGTDTLKKMLDRSYLAGTIPAGDPNRDLLAARAMVTACNAATALADRSFLPLLRKIIDPSTEPDADVRFIANQAIHKIEDK
jgi:HEAT repeat protein